MASNALLISLIVAVLVTVPSAVRSQSCKSKKLGNNNVYALCETLPALSSQLHYTYNATNGSLSIAFVATPSKPGGWISWAINPTGTGMVGAQAFVALEFNNTLRTRTLNISGYRALTPGKLAFDFWDVSAEKKNDAVTLYASLTVPGNIKVVNQVWQIGPGVDANGMMQPHAFTGGNLQSKSVLSLTGAPVPTASPAPSPSPSPSTSAPSPTKSTPSPSGSAPSPDDGFLTDGTLETPVDWIPGMCEMRLKDIPSFIRITNLNDIMFNQLRIQCQKTLKSSAILFNTFYDFEHEVLEAIEAIHPNTYAAGPLSMLMTESKTGSANSSLWKEDAQCLEWLDKRDPETVVYVNYGSITTMSDEHLLEFAWGLANSRHPFLWVLRPDVVMGESPESMPLPEDFLDKVKDRGLVVTWCPQDEVLKHPSIGAYLTHCGWNSILESLAGGVPLLCWPFFAEQQTNCRYACTAWGIGIEVDSDVQRGELEELVREMMESDRGRELRRNAKEWRRKVEASTAVVGSSTKEFERFIKIFLHNEKVETD